MSRYGVSGSVGASLAAVAPDRRRRVLVPPGVALRVPRRGDGIARTADDEDPANRRRERRGLVRDGLERHPRTSAQESVGRDEHARVAVGEPRGHGRGGVAREDRGVDRADPAEREDRDHGLRQQREQDPDPVPGADPVRAEAADGRLDLGQELAVGQPADRAILALPDERLARRDRRSRAVPWPPAHSRTRRRPTSAPRPAHGSRRAPRSAAAARRSRCRPRPHPRTSPGRRPRGPGALRATARRSRAGTARGATRGAARASAATRHPGHPGRRSARQGRWPCRKTSAGRGRLVSTSSTHSEPILARSGRSVDSIDVPASAVRATGPTVDRVDGIGSAVSVPSK